MGGGVDPELARKVLRKFNGDIQRAAEAILNNEIPEDNDPYWTSGSTSQQTLPASNSVIDLTEEEDYRQGRPLTRERSETSVRVRADPPSNRTIKFAPTDRAPDPNWQMVPANVKVEMGHEDQTLKRAIEASLNDFVVDETDLLPDEETIREGGRPIAIRTEQAGHAYAGLVLQALFYIPQVRRAVAALRIGSEAEPPADPEKRTLWHLIELFTNMDLAQLGVILDKEVAPILVRGQWTGTQEQLGLHASDMITNLGLAIENHLCMEDGSRPHIFYFSHGTAEFREGPQAKIKKTSGDGCVVSVDVSPTQGPNDLVSRLSNSLSRYYDSGFIASTHEVIIEPSDLAMFKPQVGDRPPSYTNAPASPEPLVYPKILYLDRFLSGSAVIVEGKRRDETALLAEIESLKMQRRSLTGYNNRDTIKDLKTSIHYYEKVAGPRDDAERLAVINTTTAKLKRILSTIEKRAQELDHTIEELEAKVAVIFDCPELRQYRYDLRAVLFHTGVPGRKHIYSYVRDEHGNWWKTVDCTVTEVAEEVVLNDTTGLHLGAGPFMIFYSRHMSDEELQEPVPWPQRLVDFVQQHNDTFLSMLPQELAAKVKVARAPSASTSRA
ncbi:hypothetical protein BDN72DRAFT_757458 [Pluteus cervinus]|uniref:Uncharacterized protein n=1 Tax=Pluteus cervinus TaxID=181527 RepID=A0ACD3BEZ9_9AGAR|nr:hypothetical protein BDN72DRAFT_757458 [Pluteus cervinus]